MTAALDDVDDVGDVGVIARFVDAFVAGRLDEFAALLAADCDDANPMPHQPPGRDGVVLKCALFHAEHRGARVSAAAPVRDAGGVVVEWTTTFASGLVTRWRGRFTTRAQVVARFEVARVG